MQKPISYIMKLLSLPLIGAAAAILLLMAFAYSGTPATAASTRSSAGSFLAAIFYWIKSQPADSTKLLISTVNSTSTHPAQLQVSTVTESTDPHNAVTTLGNITLGNGTAGHLEILFVNDTQLQASGQTEPVLNATTELARFNVN
jgi:hypothetical protein